MGEKYIVSIDEPTGPDGIGGWYGAYWRITETKTGTHPRTGGVEGPATDKVSLYAEAERQAYAAKAALESAPPVVEPTSTPSPSPSVPDPVSSTSVLDPNVVPPAPAPRDYQEEYAASTDPLERHLIIQEAYDAVTPLEVMVAAGVTDPERLAAAGSELPEQSKFRTDQPPPPVSIPSVPFAAENPPAKSGNAAKKINPHDGKLSRDPLAGLDNTVISEMQPKYNRSECEKEIKGRNNARIILGRDRDHGIVSGYGNGWTRCGAIDIVVGLQGWAPSEGGRWKGKPGKSPWIPGRADKNFGSMNNDKPGDAARIYVSQRANIDEYFDICGGSVGHSVADSAIGLKADSIRIMSRKGIKLVTGKNPPGRNSIDGKLSETYGIDLIAGNRDLNTGIQVPGVSYPTPLQPIPKGDNLEEALLAIVERVDRLNNIVSSILMGLQTITQAIMEPRVGGNAGGPVSAILTGGMASCIKFMTDIQRYSGDLNVQRQAISGLKIDYLNEMGIKYINSRHNRTN
jgi:hypothetical protein